MTSLLELPREVLQNIWVMLVRDHGLSIAVSKRQVCKAFDAEIRTAIWLTRCLENSQCRYNRRCDSRIAIDYLWMRTITDHARQHWLTMVIYNTIDYIVQLAPEVSSSNVDLVREACSAIMQAHGPYHRLTILLDYRFASATTAETSLAFAAYLNMTAVVEKLLWQGVQDAETVFGNAIQRVVEHESSSLASVYLQTKMGVSLQQQDTKGDVLTGTDLGVCPHNISNTRRGISIAMYDRAIRHAVIHCRSTDTVELLVNALCEDEIEPKQSKLSIFSAYTMSTISPDGLRTTVHNMILAVAMRNDRIDMARMALVNGASPDPIPQKKHLTQIESPLNIAAKKGNLELFELLLSHGANPWFKLCRPLLSYAVSGGSKDIVRICLELGMTNFPTASPSTGYAYLHPLMAALFHAQHEIRHYMLRTLLDHGIVFKAGSKLDHKLFETASQHRDSESLALLEKARKESFAFQIATESNIVPTHEKQVMSCKYPLRSRGCLVG